jgi:hypothetical protein
MRFTRYEATSNQRVLGPDAWRSLLGRWGTWYLFKAEAVRGALWMSLIPALCCACCAVLGMNLELHHHPCYYGCVVEIQVIWQREHLTADMLNYNCCQQVAHFCLSCCTLSPNRAACSSPCTGAPVHHPAVPAATMGLHPGCNQQQQQWWY